MTKVSTPLSRFLEDFVKSFMNSLSDLFKSKGTLVLIIVIAILAFAMGYLSGRPSQFHDGDSLLNKQKL